MASEGQDLDPEVEIVARRTIGLRRYYTKNERNKKKVAEFYEQYARNKEPGIDVGDEYLCNKTITGEPATPEGAKLRKLCNPQGPTGFLFESLHLQAATLNKSFEIKQWNQQEIAIRKAPCQQIAPLVEQMATRDRTSRAEGTRNETNELNEIDTYATEANNWNEVKDGSEKVGLRIVLTGSSWTQAATFWTGKADDQICKLCMKEKETSDHFWFCESLRKKPMIFTKSLQK